MARTGARRLAASNLTGGSSHRGYRMDVASLRRTASKRVPALGKTATFSKTWTFVAGDWQEGNVPIMGPRTHAAWLSSIVFDGARAFEGVTPDLDRHCERVNRSAESLSL